VNAIDIILPDEGFILTAAEKQEALNLKKYAPFRDWHAVKPKGAPAIFLDTQRKAKSAAKKNAPAAIYRVQ
jgi:hypothetical protein